MAGNAMAIHSHGENLEEHIATLLEKLESFRELNAPMAADGKMAKNYRKPIQVEIRTLEFWRSIISECLASFFFVFIVSGASCNQFGRGIDKSNESILSTALATGLAMSLLHHCFERISGGHVNPAVSLAMAAVKRISPLRAFLFVVAQCGGGIAGAALLYGVTPGPYPVSSSPLLGPWEKFGIELVLTFIVVFAHFSKVESRILSRSSMVIGVAYSACTLAGMPMLNPARALGPAFVMNKLWDNHWVFWLGPVFGGILAAVVHEFIFNSKRQNKRPADSIDGDSSMHSEDEPFEDNKYHPAAYRPVGSGNPTSPPGGYCPSIASTSVYSSPPARLDRPESVCNGNKCKPPQQGDGIYSGTRSLYNAKITEGIYSGTKSMYTKSPVLTRSNLNRSQSVYAKSQNPRDLLPKPGPLVPAQSLYPIKLGNGGGHLSSNIRDFGSPVANFISGIKTNDGNYVKVSQGSEQNSERNDFNQSATNYLAGRNGTSKSYHDVADADKSTPFQQQNFGVGDHLTNQNVQNQHLLNMKPDKNPPENIYGIRNASTGGIYPGGDALRGENKREIHGGKRECYDLPISRGHDGRPETARSQASSNFNRTAAYVKSIQNNPGPLKTRDSNYDIVPSGIREVPNFNQKPHNRSDTSDYGSNSLTNQFSE